MDNLYAGCHSLPPLSIKRIKSISHTAGLLTRIGEVATLVSKPAVMKHVKEGWFFSGGDINVCSLFDELNTKRRAKLWTAAHSHC